MESCIISEWIKKRGDTVNEGDILLSYETDKASFDLSSPASGIILEIFFNAGDEVPILTNIAVIGQEGESFDEFKPDFVSPEKTSTIETPVSSGELSGQDKPSAQKDSFTETTGKIKISPRARNLAEKLKVPVQQIKGSGHQGRIVEQDIRDAASLIRTTHLTAEIADKERKYPGDKPTGPGGRYRASDLVESINGSTGDWVIKELSNIRRIIADRMYASLNNSAQITHHTSADARRILKYRKQFKAASEQGKGENITLNDMVCLAVIRALKNKPDINSHFLGDKIRSYYKVHLGIAVDTDRGLMVPALKNADDYSLPGLSLALKSLADQCRKGNIDPELLASTAASFTVSNLGIYGVEMFTPVLNLPQAGILGVNTIIQRPADIGNGVIGIVPFIGLSLTYDHRAIDGAPASAFLKEVKDQVENLNIDL